jgi:hypothetical protein
MSGKEGAVAPNRSVAIIGSGLIDRAQRAGRHPDYCQRYGPSLSRLSAADPDIDQGDNLEHILTQWKPLKSDQVAARMRWRDRRLAALKTHKRSQTAST